MAKYNSTLPVFGLMLTILIISACAVSKKKTFEKTVTHLYTNIVFQPVQIQKNISENIMLTITPIDAKSIDKETYEAAIRDGSYEKELATIIEKEKVKDANLNKRERAILGAKERATKSIEKLRGQGQIPPKVANVMVRRIWQGEDYGVTGTEVASLSEIETFHDTYNPFKANDKYLSIFKLTFENNGKDIGKINIANFQIISGEEQLYPLTTKYFEESLKGEPEKIKNAYRMNMPDELTLTPNQRVVKYISIPAINPANEKLALQLVRNNSVVDFDFFVEGKSLVKTYVLEPYYFYPDDGSYDTRINYVFVLEYENGPVLPTKSESIHLNIGRKNIPVKVYSVSYSEYFERVKYGVSEKNTLDTYKNNRIKLKYITME